MYLAEQGAVDLFAVAGGADSSNVGLRISAGAVDGGVTDAAGWFVGGPACRCRRGEASRRVDCDCADGVSWAIRALVIGDVAHRRCFERLSDDIGEAEAFGELICSCSDVEALGHVRGTRRARETG